jgi:tRNA-(ms[2]io[6]A)-hydroxylase
MAAKRHLPLVQSNADDDAPRRTPWQWVAFGAVAIFVVWLPVAAATAAMLSRMVPRLAAYESNPTVVVALSATWVVGFGVATVAGSFVVGRWGGAAAGFREAVLSGLVAAIVAVMATWVSFGFSPGALSLVLLALPFAALGGKLGRGARARA